MKFNNEKLKALSLLPDDALWKEITKMANERGYTLPSEAPSKENMEKLKRALSGADKINLSQAVKLMQNYKKK